MILKEDQKIGKKFYPENENYFVEYADQNDITIDIEFKADGRMVSSFSRLHARADRIHIQFEYRDFGTVVKINEDNPEIVKIHPPGLEKAILKEQQEAESND